MRWALLLIPLLLLGCGNSVPPDRCVFEKYFSCVSYEILEDEIKVVVNQSSGFNMHNLDLTSDSCKTNSLLDEFPDATSQEFTLKDCNFVTDEHGKFFTLLYLVYENPQGDVTSYGGGIYTSLK